jgi:orotidine-5'-phosphate decarboxylase
MTPERDALCVALDGSDRQWILDTADSLIDEVGWLKLGLEAFAAHGPELVHELSQRTTRVFLDLKLHDIPTTVRRAAANCAASGARLLTVHASGGRDMIEAAIEGAREASTKPRLKIIAVTLLTSLDWAALSELGLSEEPEKTVLRWTDLARQCGVDGVVASAREAAAIRSGCGPDFLIVTPGIRPSWHGMDDQRRAVTPAEAVAAGVDILVIGRPITRAPSPVDAVRRIVEEMNQTQGTSE